MLRTVPVGRLAVLAGGRPDIFPINYTVDAGTLVFRTSEGTKLTGASEDAPVAVEADSVTGRRFKVTEPMTWWTRLSGAVRTAPK